MNVTNVFYAFKKEGILPMKAKVEAAQKRIVFGLIGLVVVLLSFMIINLVFNFLGLSFFQ